MPNTGSGYRDRFPTRRRAFLFLGSSISCVHSRDHSCLVPTFLQELWKVFRVLLHQLLHDIRGIVQLVQQEVLYTLFAVFLLFPFMESLHRPFLPGCPFIACSTRGFASDVAAAPHDLKPVFVRPVTDRCHFVLSVQVHQEGTMPLKRNSPVLIQDGRTFGRCFALSGHIPALAGATVASARLALPPAVEVS